MVQTLHLHCRGHRIDPWWRKQDPVCRVARPQKKIKKVKAPSSANIRSWANDIIIVSRSLPAHTVQDSELPMVYPLGRAHSLMNDVKMVARSSLRIVSQP